MLFKTALICLTLRLALSADKYFTAAQSDIAPIEKKQDALKQVRINTIPESCASVNGSETDAYYINPSGWKENSVIVLCDFENHFNLGGGWTVFQRRMDGSVDFYRNWTMYKNGFGYVNGEHWLGLEKLHRMTKSGGHELLVLLEDFEGNSAYALYDEFKIDSEEEKYKLTLGRYSGTAGNSMGYENGMKFSTKDDMPNLRVPCATRFKGAWWFNSCYMSHLNGPYYKKGEHLDQHGVEWIDFPRVDYSLKATKMMFRNRS